MKTDNDMSFPAWLWVILGAIALVAGSVTFKMVQAYTAGPQTSSPPPAAVTPAPLGDSQPNAARTYGAMREPSINAFNPLLTM